MDLYVFATKYVHFHNPNIFPIVDNLLMDLLAELQFQYPYYPNGFTKTALKDYLTYKKVLDTFAVKFGIETLGYKKIDQGLWAYAKYEYAKHPSKKIEPLPKKFYIWMDDLVKNV